MLRLTLLELPFLPDVTVCSLLRGVVQLFNAVKKHQKNVDDKVKEVGGSERKKAKILGTVSKRDFIDVLRRTEEGPRGSGTPTDTVSSIISNSLFVASKTDTLWPVHS